MQRLVALKGITIWKCTTNRMSHSHFTCHLCVPMFCVCCTPRFTPCQVPFMCASSHFIWGFLVICPEAWREGECMRMM